MVRVGSLGEFGRNIRAAPRPSRTAPPGRRSPPAQVQQKLPCARWLVPRDPIRQVSPTAPKPALVGSLAPSAVNRARLHQLHCAFAGQSQGTKPHGDGLCPGGKVPLQASTPVRQCSASVTDCFYGGGKMGACLRTTDWSKSPLGAADSWPQSLRTAVSICLECRTPVILAWGPELTVIHNDDYAAVLGDPQAALLGGAGRDVCP